MSRKLIFGESKIDLPEGLSMNEAKELAQNLLPGIADAEGHEDADGNYVFTKRAGRKGC
jgi:hypothetical protein